MVSIPNLPTDSPYDYPQASAHSSESADVQAAEVGAFLDSFIFSNKFV